MYHSVKQQVLLDSTMYDFLNSFSKIIFKKKIRTYIEKRDPIFNIKALI